uniref:Uncharacterized protein n=1 Tax=Arundo donax TaxID=35708 RepID=A0A0A9DRH6_ARUDO
MNWNSDCLSENSIYHDWGERMNQAWSKYYVFFFFLSSWCLFFLIMDIFLFRSSVYVVHL